MLDIELETWTAESVGALLRGGAAAGVPVGVVLDMPVSISSLLSTHRYQSVPVGAWNVK